MLVKTLSLNQELSSRFIISSYKHIIFDFDGVLADTNDIRVEGYRMLFQGYPDDQIQRMVDFARVNGGLSRHVKIRYFFETIRRGSISEKEVFEWADKYSAIVKQQVIEAPAIAGATEFLARYQDNFDFALISGSEQAELRDVCRQRGIAHFFVEILGSPALKEVNLAQFLARQGWEKDDCLFIGDSINDHEAVKKVGIPFLGRNSGIADWSKMDGVWHFDDFSQIVYI